MTPAEFNENGVFREEDCEVVSVLLMPEGCSAKSLLVQSAYDRKWRYGFQYEYSQGWRHNGCSAGASIKWDHQHGRYKTREECLDAALKRARHYFASQFDAKDCVRAIDRFTSSLCQLELFSEI